MIFIAICSCLLTLASGKVNPDIEAGKSVDISVCVFVCVCVCVYVHLPQRLHLCDV